MAITKWEYCEVNYSDGRIFYFSESEIKRIVVGRGNAGEYIQKHIAKMGLEGWEMTGVVHDSGDPEYVFMYFKRPIQE